MAKSCISIDPKGRVFIPASFRDGEEKMKVVIDYLNDDRVDIYKFEDFEARLEELLTKGYSELAVAGETEVQTLDGQGRIMLRKEMRDKWTKEKLMAIVDLYNKSPKVTVLTERDYLDVLSKSKRASLHTLVNEQLKETFAGAERNRRGNK